MDRSGAVRTRLATGVAGGLVAGLVGGVLVGCGGDEQAADPTTVVTGTVLEQGAPAAGVEVRLLGWPATATDAVAMTGGGEGSTPAMEEIAAAVADDDGRFVLEADVEDLTARASSGGLVDALVQAEGGEQAEPATVRLERDPSTGVTEVVAVEDLVLDLGD